MRRRSPSVSANFPDIPAAARELHRIIRPSGVLVIAELSEPTNPVLRTAYKLYAGNIIPLIGRFFSDDKDAYTYLPKSIAAMPQREKMVAILQEAGFSEAFYHSIFPGYLHDLRGYQGASLSPRSPRRRRRKSPPCL